MTMQSGLGTTHGTAVPLLGVEVRAEVVAGHALATVRQRYRNTEARTIEATYTFPLPTRSIVTGFAMSIGDRRFEGEVKERAAAFQQFDEAVTAGHGAALLEEARPNVFTASVGNLLPGEETLIEIQYVEPLLADEGAVRWSIPTLVAPRYIAASVTDAAAITPLAGPGGDAYGLDLEVTFDLGAAVDVASPSHLIAVSEIGGRTTVRLRQKDVALDRDVVVMASARTAMSAVTPIAASVCHRRRKDGALAEPGTVAVMLVPDLGAAASEARKAPRHVVLLVDRSGSMGGTSMPEARTAMKLCLRQLREGDRFNVLAFDTEIEAFATEMVPFGPATLAKVDAWISGIEARGGTELLAPMLEAARLAPDGLVVLLTDGEVANEAEIVDAFMAARGVARVYSFGIGSNVSDLLLHDLAERTGGAVELIHPGERIDEKVTSQFARATAERITDVTIKTRGIELAEIAPAEGRVLVDGEPTAIFARYDESGRGALEIRGKKNGENFYLEVAIDLEEASERPALEKLWAQARIRDLERALVPTGPATAIGGRRAESMKERIVALAQRYGVGSRHTSFVVVEKRTGERRMHAQPEARAVPVMLPAGWAVDRNLQSFTQTRAGSVAACRRMSPPSAPAMSLRAMTMPRGAMVAPPARSYGGGMPAGMPAAASPRSAPPPLPAPSPSMDGMVGPPPSSRQGDPALAILARQGASGLWEEPRRDPVERTVEAMLALVRLGLSSRHMIHGAQIKKAIDALLVRLAANRATDVKLRELALGVAWLLASGPRTRSEIELAAKGSALAVTFGDEPAVRAYVERLVT